MSGVRGFNALQIILASGYTMRTEIGHIPAEVAREAHLPEPATLVHADDSLNFHLAGKSSDPIRRDTSIYPWIVRTMPSIVTAPDYLLARDRRCAFELIKRVSPPEQYPSVSYIRAPIKFVASDESRPSELWVTTVVLHSDRSVIRLLRRAMRIGA
jgi:hypothetical protein